MKIFFSLLSFVCLFFIANAQKNISTNATCSDMGGENGWGAWEWQIGTSPNVFPQPPSSSPPVPSFSITSGGGVDQCTPGPNPGDPAVPFVAPGFGNKSLLLGEPNVAGCKAEKLSYTLTVTAADTNFMFSYAVVFQDGNHSSAQQAFVSLYLGDINGNPILQGGFTDILYSNSLGVYPSICGSYYKAWTSHCISLTPYIGQNIYIVIMNSDCSGSDCAHYCYSYWDFMCGSCMLTSIAEENKSSFEIFPSISSSGMFSIKNISEINNLSVYNLVGENIYSEGISQSQSTEINLSNQPNGIYFLKLKTDSGITTKKIVIAK